VTVAPGRGGAARPREVEPQIAPEPFAFAPEAWAPLPGSAPVTLMEVTGCRWPASDPFAALGSLDLFCNCTVVPGRSWCAEHLARATRTCMPSAPVSPEAAQTSVQDERGKLAA
jgi:hypothetical protein